MHLIVSREARTLVGKHAWSCFDRVAYGYVGGVGNTVSCVLPLAAFPTQPEARIAADDPMLTRSAMNVLRGFGLRLIGRYCSSGELNDFPEATSLWLRQRPFTDYPVFIEYLPMCCRGCSHIRYHVGSRTLGWGDVALSAGKRLSNAINQRRVIAAWYATTDRRNYRDTLIIEQTADNHPMHRSGGG